jgi:hypothetical protein
MFVVETIQTKNKKKKKNLVDKPFKTEEKKKKKKNIITHTTLQKYYISFLSSKTTKCGERNVNKT